MQLYVWYLQQLTDQTTKTKKKKTNNKISIELLNLGPIEGWRMYVVMITSKPPSGIARQLGYGPKCPNGTEEHISWPGQHVDARRSKRPDWPWPRTASAGRRETDPILHSYATPGRGPRPSAEPVNHLTRTPPLHSSGSTTREYKSRTFDVRARLPALRTLPKQRYFHLRISRSGITWLHEG